MSFCGVTVTANKLANLPIRAMKLAHIFWLTSRKRSGLRWPMAGLAPALAAGILLLLATGGASPTASSSSAGCGGANTAAALSTPVGDVVIALVDRQPGAPPLPQRMRQLLQAYVRGSTTLGAASGTRIAICRFGDTGGLRVLTPGGFTAEREVIASALAAALAEDAAAVPPGGGEAGALSPSAGVITTLEATTKALTSLGLPRRDGVAQAVLVVGAVPEGKGAPAAAAVAPPPLNLRKRTTPVDIAAAKMFEAALQLRNDTARAMAAAAQNTAHAVWFPSQSAVRVAFLLSGRAGSPGRVAAETALGEPYFGNIAGSDDGGDIELGVAVKLMRLVHEKAPSRSLQARLLEEGIWTAVWDGGSGNGNDRAWSSNEQFDESWWSASLLNDTALLPLPPPLLPVSVDGSEQQCEQPPGIGDGGGTEATVVAAGVTTQERASGELLVPWQGTNAVIPKVKGWSTASGAEEEEEQEGEEDEAEEEEGSAGLRRLDRFAEDSERGAQPLLLARSVISDLGAWHTEHGQGLVDGLCEVAAAGGDESLAHDVHVIDDGHTPLFAKVDHRSGFARIGLVDVHNRSETDSEAGGDDDLDYFGPWSPLPGMRTRTLAMHRLLNLMGVDCREVTRNRQLDSATTDDSSDESDSALVAEGSAGGNHRWASWSGAVPSSLRSHTFKALGPFFPEGRPGEMLLNVRGGDRSFTPGTLPHYDADKHTMIQISGVQVVLLLPPAAYRRLRPFPKLHPFAHHSSLGLSDGNGHNDNKDQDKAVMQELLAVHGYAVTLQPGDALYIPPFWWVWSPLDQQPAAHDQNQDPTPCIWISAHSADDAVGGILMPLYSREYGFEHLRRRLGRTFAVRLLLDLIIHRVHGAHSTRQWMERLAISRYRAQDATLDFTEITIDDVVSPTKWCENADRPTQADPAPCSLAVGEPLTIVPSDLCNNPYRVGEFEAPLPGRDMLLLLNEDADYVLHALANIGTGSNHGPLLIEGREQILADWVEEIVSSIVGVHRAPAFIRHCFREQHYYHTSIDPGGDDSGEWELWDEFFKGDLKLDYDAPAPNMIDGRVIEKGWRKRLAEELEKEVREEFPELSDREVVIECERRS